MAEPIGVAGPAAYVPMRLTDLAGHLAAAPDEPRRRRLLLEFLEEYRWEGVRDRARLLAAEPSPTGDERWDVLLAAVAEHLGAEDGRAGPAWAQSRTLSRWWFPDNTPYARADCLVRSPAAFRRRGIFIAEQDLVRA